MSASRLGVLGIASLALVGLTSTSRLAIAEDYLGVQHAVKGIVRDAGHAIEKGAHDTGNAVEKNTPVDEANPANFGKPPIGIEASQPFSTRPVSK